MNLTPAQKIRIIIFTICFMFLFGFIRNIFLNTKFNTRDFMINIVLIFIWLGLSQAIANTLD